ncbi:MAG: hypothetical protein EA353_14255 [Puniceicoccaceae bacterium]|nr:MAG: hypothetical protein EA353_14255 [Puniceicoccaceae bacterium]
MNLNDAVAQIQRSCSKMQRLYGRTVFDEFAIIGIERSQLKSLYYEGPREAVFMASFADDSLALRKELRDGGRQEAGAFNFTREAEGSGIDAYICLGQDLYLFCNHTEKSMKDISEDPAWLDTQGCFLNLAQAFAVDPLEI